MTRLIQNAVLPALPVALQGALTATVGQLAVFTNSDGSLTLGTLNVGGVSYSASRMVFRDGTTNKILVGDIPLLTVAHLPSNVAYKSVTTGKVPVGDLQLVGGTGITIDSATGTITATVTGGVTSVNNKTGVVNLTANDVGASPAGHGHSYAATQHSHPFSDLSGVAAAFHTHSAGDNTINGYLATAGGGTIVGSGGNPLLIRVSQTGRYWAFQSDGNLVCYSSSTGSATWNITSIGDFYGSGTINSTDLRARGTLYIGTNNNFYISPGNGIQLSNVPVWGASSFGFSGSFLRLTSGNANGRTVLDLTTNAALAGLRSYGTYYATQGGGHAFFNSGGTSYSDVYAMRFIASSAKSPNGFIYADIAEMVPNPKGDLAAAELAVIDFDNDEAVSQHEGTQYELAIAGVVSTAPAFTIASNGASQPVKDAQGEDVLGPDGQPLMTDPDAGLVPMALAGRVPAKVTTKYITKTGEVVYRKIKRGYMLVASSIPGHLMAVDPSDCPNGIVPLGTVVGKAMQEFIPAPGEPTEGVIKVWVNIA